jgi:sodium/proline symporter
MNPSVILAALLYFSLLLLIGLISYWRFGRNSSDMSLGGRSLNYFVTAIAAHASDMSAWLFMAYPAAIYSQGALQLSTAFGLILFMYLNWHYVAPGLRRQSEKYGVSTLSGYFAVHYQDSKNRIRLVSSMMAVIFFTAYLTSGLVALGTLFEATMGIPDKIGSLLALAVIIVYTLIGGFVAVAWNDFFQGIFLLGVILYVPILLFFNIPQNSMVQANELWSRFFQSSTSPYQVLSLIFGWGLGYFGQPHILSHCRCCR